MASLYLDNDVSLRLVPYLRAAGHNVTSAHEAGMTRATDDEHLLLALQQRRILTTHNRSDYTLLHDLLSRWPSALGLAMPTHAGILVLDQSTPEDLFSAMDALLTSAVGVALAGQLLWWRPTRGWRRRVAGQGWDLPPWTVATG